MTDEISLLLIGDQSTPPLPSTFSIEGHDDESRLAVKHWRQGAKVDADAAAAIVFSFDDNALAAAKSCLNSGVPLLVYGPPAGAADAIADGLDQLLRCAEATGTAIAPFWPSLSHPLIVGLAQDIESGRIGLPTKVNVRLFAPAPACRGAILLGSVAAGVTLAARLARCDVQRLFATRPAASTAGDVSVATAVVQLDRAVTATVVAGWAWGIRPNPGDGAAIKIDVHGSHGVVAIDSTRNPAILGPSATLYGAGAPAQWSEAETEAAVDALRDPAARADGYKAIWNMRTLYEGLHRAVRGGQPVLVG